MRLNPSILSALRHLHLYLGVFTAPAILFFALTGALQTFNLHEPTHGYRPARWILVLAELHKKQTADVPVRKLEPQKADAHTDSSSSPVHGSFPLKVFFLLVSVSLCASTISGYYLSWKYRRNRTMLVALTAAGFVAPLLMIAL